MQSADATRRVDGWPTEAQNGSARASGMNLISPVPTPGLCGKCAFEKWPQIPDPIAADGLGSRLPVSVEGQISQDGISAIHCRASIARDHL